MSAPLTPIPAHAPLPHRKTLRQWLIPLSERTTARAIFLLALDYALLLAALAGTVLAATGWVKLLPFRKHFPASLPTGRKRKLAMQLYATNLLSPKTAKKLH